MAHSNITQSEGRFTQVKISVPSKLHSDIVQELYSEVEGRVPYGAWSRLIVNLLSLWLKQQQENRNGTK